MKPAVEEIEAGEKQSAVLHNHVPMASFCKLI